MLCKCGCGQETKIVKRTRGAIRKGTEQEYIRGHWSRGIRTVVEPPNPSGICQCGCGRPAPIATVTQASLGHMKGHPVRFIRGHVVYLRMREQLTPDLWHEENRGYETPCWIFNLKPQTKAGYCRVTLGRKARLAHRASYEQFVGPIPAGLMIDHLCRVPSCVNPSHLEPVTNAENQRRGREARLSHIDFEMIRQSSLSIKAIARLTGLSRDSVSRIRRGDPLF